MWNCRLRSEGPMKKSWTQNHLQGANIRVEHVRPAGTDSILSLGADLIGAMACPCSLCLLSLTGRGKTESKLKTSNDSLWKGIDLNYAIWFNLTWQIVWVTSQYRWIFNIRQCKENEIFKKLHWDNWLVRGELPSKSCTETNPRHIKELFLLNQSINKL